MSGGSYNYLYTKSPDDLIYAYQDDLQRMIDRLIVLGYEDVARELVELRLTIAHYRVYAETIMNRLTGVMKAVEWLDSCDWGPIPLQQAVQEYRGNIEQAAADRRV